MVASTILFMTLAAVMTSHIWGLKFLQTIELKMDATTHARELQSTLATDIRDAMGMMIGTVSSGRFTEAGATKLQQGNALMLFPNTAATNNYLWYYRDATDKKFKRYVKTNNVTTILATGVSNSIVIYAQSPTGTVLTNKESKAIVYIHLELTEYQTPRANSSTKGLPCSMYEFNAKIAGRSME